MTERNRKQNPPTTPNAMMLRRTLFLLIVCGIAAFLVLAAQLFNLQIIHHDFYETKAIDQQVRETRVNAARGTIYDTNMKILAMSASVDDIVINPSAIKKNGEDAELIARTLSEILDIDYDKILAKTAKTNSGYQLIARKVEPEVAKKVQEFKSQYKLSGVQIEENSKRYYPYSSLACQVIGFVGTDNTGLSGLEYYYNKPLTGVSGTTVHAKNAAGTDMLFTSFEDYYDGEDGKSLVTTIDSTIQYYMEKQLLQAVEDYDVQNGAAAIAMNVKTGGILGMVSLDNYDLNNYQAVSEAAQKKIDAMSDEAAKQEALAAAQQRQWRNKAINDTYEPGSTFKIITLSMGLNDGVIKPTDSFYCGGSLLVTGDKTPRHCWKTAGHGSQTLTQALQHSCNVAFMQIGLKVGAERFYDYCEAFGLMNASDDPTAQLTGNTGVDLPGESGSLWWSHKVFCNPDSKSQLAAASFGQTFNITPLQLITAVSACVNGGKLMKPYLVKETLNPDGTVASKTEPTLVRQVISEETSKAVCEMLERVVSDKVEGTGKNAYVAGYRIGGKTGTSENVAKEAETGQKQYIVSFIGVAPMDDPQIAVLVLLDDPSSDCGVYVSGGNMGAPTVAKMMTDILPYMGIEAKYDSSEKQVADKTVPNITGMTQAEAQKKATDSGLTLRIVGSGEKVTAQLPAANTVVAAGSQMIAYCGAEVPTAQVTMPNLSGMSYALARQTLANYGLYVRATGPVSSPAAVTVSSQSIGSGTPVKPGTVVEVTVIDTSDQGRY
ncbi:MAG: penicillin-binding transpeptidase domain-containing protein [Oscillospiraceae bacterium]|jgi:stage V sporulation protein D (sporulation-specific penicillin-binding protein)